MDIVSKIDLHELKNGVDQTSRDIANRFDFKGTSASAEVSENLITLTGDSEFQIKQIQDILRTKLAKRQVDIECLEYGNIVESGRTAKQIITAREGIDQDLARKLVKQVKQSRLKVQAAIQQDQVRVSGKKRDDLQQIIQLLKGGDYGLPLQFINFRD
jgi:uncharacterized protein YajQ (UPF0234 family)